eukprot:9021816-Ditylum_brightwellii.AAC.1
MEVMVQNGKGGTTLILFIIRYSRVLEASVAIGEKEQRGGDWIVLPFQCDWCWFGNIKLGKAKKGSREDERLLAYSRQ